MRLEDRCSRTGAGRAIARADDPFHLATAVERVIPMATKARHPSRVASDAGLGHYTTVQADYPEPSGAAGRVPGPPPKPMIASGRIAAQQLRKKR
jgi:hypothetical protein